ncbi:hypothetical protein [Caballeronia sordidicola]|uniref:Transcriptional regulator, LysR family n=1 Tax=Caballeronia sordidicola TaxID=196367 RepID=A0A226WNQ2_CABSO|nr:hypothetical protein [Caballeronia sordidicola]OXC72733.1 Transcriptional regulator, LysR family [Caballeronia sordidicola]
MSAAEGIRTAVLGRIGLAIISQWMFSPDLADGTVSAVFTDWQLRPSSCELSVRTTAW